MFIEGPTCVSESKILKPSRAIFVSPPDGMLDQRCASFETAAARLPRDEVIF